MDEYLRSVIEGEACVAREYDSWGDMPLRIDAYLTSTEPPVAYVTSVRGVVVRDASVLVFWDHTDQPQLLVGGRCEQGETLQATLRREVLEEAGLEIHEPVALGVLHYRHLGPKPLGYAYPYPDFLQAVYVARAGRAVPEAVVYDEFVRRSAFLAIDDVQLLPLRERDRPYLAAALDHVLGAGR